MDMIGSRGGGLTLARRMTLTNCLNRKVQIRSACTRDKRSYPAARLTIRPDEDHQHKLFPETLFVVLVLYPDVPETGFIVAQLGGELFDRVGTFSGLGQGELVRCGRVVVEE